LPGFGSGAVFGSAAGAWIGDVPGTPTVGRAAGMRAGTSGPMTARPVTADGGMGWGATGPPCPTANATPRQNTSNMGDLDRQWERTARRGGGSIRIPSWAASSRPTRQGVVGCKYRPTGGIASTAAFGL